MVERPFHIPVLAAEVVAWARGCLPPADAPPAGVYVDATCGGAGHATAILAERRPSDVLLLDRDPEALTEARTRLARVPPPVRLRFIHARFSRTVEVLDAHGLATADFVLADLGVSSHQLDTTARGFSFRADAPLDMRMNPQEGETAAQWLSKASAREIEHVLRAYGEERHARTIARAIARERPTTTGDLALLVERLVPRTGRPRRKHPATRTFQALRVAVNQELTELETFLSTVPERLSPGGRLAVISYHSLEDRRVKHHFRRLSSVPDLPRGLPVAASAQAAPRFRIPPGARRGVTPKAAEVRSNPRARSARLRILERCPP